MSREMFANKRFRRLYTLCFLVGAIIGVVAGVIWSAPAVGLVVGLVVTGLALLLLGAIDPTAQWPQSGKSER